MKPIGLDARMIRHTGIGTYLRGLLSEFPHTNRNHALKLLGDPQHLQSYPFPHQSFNARIYTPQEQLGYFGLLGKYSLWHAPHYNIPFFKRRTKLVVTVHDLIHWIYRKNFFSPAQAFYAKTFFKRVAQIADHVIAVSRHTQNDLIKEFNVDPKKISVVYEGVDKNFVSLASFDELQNTLAKYHLPLQYFLYVGSLKPHKNVLCLTRAFTALRKAGKLKADLVLVGKKDPSYPAGYEALSGIKTGEGVHHLSHIEHHELSHLYQGALALAHPSLYEGFGLTLLEAMACGTAVIASNAASLPEVAGDAAILFDPSDESALAGALQKIESDDSLRRELREKGFRQLRKFSWLEAAKQTFGVYERVLGK